MRHYQAADKARARLLHSNGNSYSAISLEMEVPRSTIVNWIGRRGTTIPAYPASYKTRARDMRRKGEKLAVIALEVGVSSETVRTWTLDIEIPPSLRNWRWVPRALQSKNKNLILRGFALLERKRLLLSGDYDFDRRFRTVLEKEAARELRKLFDAPLPDIAVPEPEIVEIRRTIPRPQSLSSGDPA